jgi:hypothetical protein
MDYQPTAQGEHGRAEEAQWVRLVSSGDPVKGMVLVFVQKLCTAFHEFDPAWRAGALNEQQLPFFRARLAGRIIKVLEVMRANRLETLAGFTELEGLLQMTESAATMQVLADLAEEIHAVNHALSDALEGNSAPR